MKLDIHLDSGEVVTLAPKPAGAGRRFYVLPDWLVPGWGGIPRPCAQNSGGCPGVMRVGDIENSDNGHNVPMNKDWQFFSFDLMAIVVYGRTHTALSQEEYNWLAQRWSSVYGDTTAFTNKTGAQSRHNWITGENAGQPDIALDLTRTCIGATHVGDVVQDSHGVDMVRLVSFDATNPPPLIDTIDVYSDLRIFFATTITNTKVPGGYKVNRFPQLNEPARGIFRDVPIPLLARWPVHYPLAAMRELAMTESVPSPYFP